MTRIYFCGVWPDRLEHYCFLPDGACLWAVGGAYPASPWTLVSQPVAPMADRTVARVMANGQGEPEGVRFHKQQDGWTLIAWWDRSGDPRFGSIASFAIHSVLDGDAAETYAREQFPQVFARIDAAASKRANRG